MAQHLVRPPASAIHKPRTETVCCGRRDWVLSRVTRQQLSRRYQTIRWAQSRRLCRASQQKRGPRSAWVRSALGQSLPKPDV